MIDVSDYIYESLEYGMQKFIVARFYFVDVP